MDLIGERLAEIRKDYGDRQSDLAQKLSISLSTVRSWEQGKSSPPNEMLISICRLYSVSSDYLLGLTEADPTYVRTKFLEKLTHDEIKLVKEYAEFQIWKRTHSH